jgi:hypothetical protein
VGPIAGMQAETKRKNSPHYPCRESNLSRPTGSLVTVLTELPRQEAQQTLTKMTQICICEEAVKQQQVSHVLF